MHALAAALVLAACAAKKSSKIKATKPPNEYSTMAFLVTGAALRARFRHDDAYDGPPGVQASPYVGVA